MTTTAEKYEKKEKKKKKNDHALKIITQEERVRFFSCPIKRTKKNKFIFRIEFCISVTI